MKIKDIHIENFRGLTDVNLTDLDSNVNLIIGINGAGKSSVLDAISILFSWFNARILNENGKGKEIKVDDISNVASSGSFLKLSLENGISWEIYRGKEYIKEKKSSFEELNNYVLSLRNELVHNPKFSLPIVVHYGVNRAVTFRNPEGNNKKTDDSQLSVFRNALYGNLKFNDFFQWFRNEEDYENERRIEDKDYRDPSLTAIRKALKKALPEFSDLKVSRKDKALKVKKDSKEFQINQLSDGEKVYITLICDIARRLAIANPSGNPLEGEGVVLIDEIDLHLHPQWQIKVVSTLERTFPNIQFIISSHSPLVASDTKGKVFGINHGEVVEERTFGKLSSDILSYAFGVSNARSKEVQDLIDSAYKSIDKDNLEGFNDQLKTLSQLIGADDLAISMLKLEKLRRERANKS